MSIRNVQQNSLGAKHLNAPRPIIRPKGTVIPGTALPWVRDPSWSTLPSVISSDEKFVGLHAVFPDSGNFVALSAAGNYTVDWGDGVTENISTGVTAYHSYDFTDVDLANTNGPVTFTDSGDLVTRNNHGYINGDVVRFFNIVSTTGLTEAQYYYVINATTNTFQVSETSGGSAVALTTDGTGTLLPYKQAIITVTPQGGANLTSLNLRLNHNQSGLYTAGGYSSGWLDIKLSMPNCTASGLTISSSSTTIAYHTLLEQCELVNSGGLTSYANMFQNCSLLQSVLLSNTASITNMSNMFSGCQSLQSVPLFNTANVTNMSSMFTNCYSLISVPLFNTANVTTTSGMFQNCYSLLSVPLFNTIKNTTWTTMFATCQSLQSVPLFNTSSATNMASMFQNCYVLKSVPLFNTARVNNMSSMFYYCNLLQSVPLFNTASVTNMSNMFTGCFALQSVPLFNTASVTNMSAMFQYCYVLQSVPLFNTASVTNMSNMFYGCNSLQTVPLFNTASVTNMGSMFQTCYALQSVPLFNTANVTSMSAMFYNCYALQSVSLFNTAKVTDVSSAFFGCGNLLSVPLFNTANVTTANNMFNSCSSLQSVPTFNTANVRHMGSMFSTCRSLRSIPAMNLSSNAVSSGSYTSTFASCPSITRIAANPGPKYTFTVANLQLSATALNEIYTNLPSVSSQTITVTGNYGTSSDDPTIATAKGWTVTG